MADIIQNSDLDDDKKKSTTGTQAPQAPGSVNGVSSPSVASSPTSPTQTVVNNTNQPVGAGPKQGSGFVNLQKVMQANQNNGLGQAVTGGLQKQVQQGQQNLNQSQQQFQQASQAGNVAFNTDDQARIQKVLNDPSSATADDYAAFDKYRTQNYTGPTGLQNSDQLRSQAAQLQALAQLSGSQGGRETLLQRFVGGPGYNSGEKNLDAALLGSSANTGLRDQAKQAGVLQRLVGQSQAQATAQGTNLTNAADTQKQNLINQLSGAETGAETDYNNRLAGQQQSESADYSRLLGAIRSGGQGLTADDYQKLGLTQGQSLYGLDPTQYVSGLNQTTSAAFASPQDVAKFNALAKLSGNTNTFLSQAGTGASPYTVNTASLQDSLNQRQNDYNNIQTNANQEMNNDRLAYGPFYNSVADKYGITEQDSPGAKLAKLQSALNDEQNTPLSDLYTNNMKNTNVGRIHTLIDSYNNLINNYGLNSGTGQVGGI